MTKKFVILSFLFLAFLQVLSVNVPPTHDTTKNHILYKLTEKNILPSDYKLSKKNFILRYSFNEDSVDLIESHFNRRNRSIIFIFIPLLFLIFGSVSFIMLLLTALGGMASAPIWSTMFFGSIVGYIIGWIYRVFGIISLTKFKRQNLLNHLINNYSLYIKNKKNK